VEPVHSFVSPAAADGLAGGDLLPVLPLRDMVMFPQMVVSQLVGRENSVRAIEAAMLKYDRQILLVAQKNATPDYPAADDIYRIGTVANILGLVKQPNGRIELRLEGVRRAKIVSFLDTESYIVALVEAIPDQEGDTKELEALGRTVVSQFEQYTELNEYIAPHVLTSPSQIEEPSNLAYTAARHLGLNVPQQQELLEIANIRERFERVVRHITSEIAELQARKTHGPFIYHDSLHEPSRTARPESGAAKDGNHMFLGAAPEHAVIIGASGFTRQAEEKCKAEEAARIADDNAPAAAAAEEVEAIEPAFPAADRAAKRTRRATPAPARQVAKGSILWAMPDSMRVGRRERVEVRIGDERVAESQLRDGLKGKGLPQIDQLDVSRTMRVALLADENDFSIKALSNLDQYVRDAHIARWDFDATPLRSGERVLRILVTMRLKVEGKDEVVDLESYEREVRVRVSPLHTAGQFLGKNWQWVAGSVVIPLAVWAMAHTDFGAIISQRLGITK
jgi:Lon protease-like protein